jgi:hypothetical protein
VWVELWRGGERVVECMDMFPVAPHDESRVEFSTANLEHCLLKGTRSGDFFRYMYNVGGGGGHELKINDFRAVVVCRRTAVVEGDPPAIPPPPIEGGAPE